MILFLLFIVQFSIACACLAFSVEQQQELAQKGWDTASVENRQEAQQFFDCCGFKSTDPKSSVFCPKVSNLKS